MATTLATKNDLEILGKDLLGLRRDLQSFRVEMRQDLQSLRSEARRDLLTDMESLRNEFKQGCLLVRSEMDLLRRHMLARFDEYELRMTIRMAVMLYVRLPLSLRSV